MSDEELIRRGDALYAIAGWEIPSTAIAALPAVTAPDPDAAAIRAAALREAADLLFTVAGEKGATKTPQGRTAQYYARRILALIPKGVDGRRVYMGQIMAECDCQREAECQAAGRCIAEVQG